MTKGNDNRLVMPSSRHTEIYCDDDGYICISQFDHNNCETASVYLTVDQAEKAISHMQMMVLFHQGLNA